MYWFLYSIVVLKVQLYINILLNDSEIGFWNFNIGM